MKDCEPGAMCDASIISAGQKAEHYEIASYGTLRQFADTLGLSQAAGLLEKILNEEKTADKSSCISCKYAGSRKNRSIVFNPYSFYFAT